METERLVLRRVRPGDDAPALLAMLSDERVTRFLPLFSLRDEDEAREFAVRRLSDPLSRVICLREGPSEVMGYVTLAEDDARDLGYALRRDCWGRGFAREAASAVMGRARAAGLPFVTATHDELNPASGAVMRACGLTYRYSYRELWQPKNYEVTFRMHQVDLAPGAPEYRGYWERHPRHWVG